MTQYWWMHWFWITSVLQGICMETLPQTLHFPLTYSNETLLTNNTVKVAIPILPISTPPPLNVSLKSTKKLKLLLSSAKNVTTKMNNASKEIKIKDISSHKNESFENTNLTKKLEDKNHAVIKTNPTRKNVSEEITTVTMDSLQNDTENVTCLGEDLNLNQSLVQNSERIGVEEKVISSESSSSNLTAAGITGITVGCVAVVGIICGVSFFVYKYHRFNRPQVLNDHCSNPDSSGYIDDASIRDNSEEMYSLDNDSFLNSLEAMTIQNYWTDTVKHTKL